MAFAHNGRELLEMDEAAAVLGITRRHMQNICNAGIVECFMFNSRTRLVYKDTVLQLKKYREAALPRLRHPSAKSDDVV